MTPLLRLRDNLILFASTLLTLVADVVWFLGSVCVHLRLLQQKTSFCVSSWRCIKSAT